MSDQPPENRDEAAAGAGPARRPRRRGEDLPYYDGERIGDETPWYRRWGLGLILFVVVAAVAVAAILLMS